MLDIKRLTLIAGKGGNGAVSFMHEPLNIKGGPDGGDGGQGGDVVLVADPGVDTLVDYRRVRRIQAEHGGKGSRSNRTGKSAEDKEVKVPVGTVVWVIEADERRLLADLNKPGARVVAARGGHGGKGNARYASAINQEPLLAQGGEAGEQIEVLLEVKLLADVAIVGPPNAGKSTLLSVISAAKPKIADYPFTTLSPVMGVVDHRNERMVFLEIPGLVEGAHEGKGLGLEFLRHAERVRVIVQLIDGLEPDLVSAYQQIDEELRLYPAGLNQKPRILAVTKMDLPEAREAYARQKKQLEHASGVEPHAISAATREGVEPLLDMVLEVLKTAPPPSLPVPDTEGGPMVVQPHRPRDATRVWKEGDVFVISCAPVERLLAMANMNDWRTRMQMQKELGKYGVIKALNRLGVQSGDTVRIGDIELEWQ